MEVTDNPASTTPNNVRAVIKLINRSVRSYWFRTLAQAIFTLWLVATFTFFLIRLLPSDPVDAYVDRLMSKNDLTYEQAYAKATLLIGLDYKRPILEQYGLFMGSLARGDLGQSILSTGTPVSKIIAAVLPWTLFSVGLGLLISFVLGLGLGMLMAYWRNSLFDTLATTIASILGSIPNYLIAILILITLGINLKLLPVSSMRGAYSAGVEPGFTPQYILDITLHAALPILTYLLSSLGGWALTMKNSTLGVLGEEYVTAAQARGLGQGRIILAYVGRNASLPLFTQLALSIGFIVGGATVIEQYFVYPGIGYRIVEAIRDRDYPIMQGLFLVIAVSVILANLLTDVLYAQIDPRVRVGQAS